jgi:GNAT superfamily N-acetyltransferase
VARFVRDRRRPENAEIAVIVTDAWQGHGVGSALLSRLADRARAEGVTRFTGLMLSGNRPMARLFAELGEPQVVSRDGVTVELAVEIGPTSDRP